ncbi:MAG: endonuclease III [Deltaproteobacteria bacterium]|nr:endonuclease III [Deltaproteobacteria bacterium]
MERPPTKAARARQVIERLGEAHPEEVTALAYGSPLQLMVAVVLSAQCTDVRVNQVTPALFARYPTVEDLARASQSELEGLIRSCGLYRNKAHALIAACQAISRSGGEVPTGRAALALLPGIGNKSAGVISMHLSEERALPVDTHVARLAFRLGFSTAERPDEIEKDLRALLPPALWKAAHHRLIWHGRRFCTARSPRCLECPVRSLCPRRGLAPL